MSDKLKSRKFWLAMLGAVLPIVAHYLDGSVSLDQSLQIAGGVIASYVLGQGYVDGKSVEGTVPAGRESA